MPEASQIGLDMFHYAEVLTDTPAVCAYDTPVAITGSIAADVKNNGTITTQYADDGPAVNASSRGRVEASLEFTNVSLSQKAFILGHEVISGVIGPKANDTPKDLAIGFRSQKSNGAYRYKWILKGNFSVPDSNNKTREDKINFNTTKMQYVGLRREYDGRLEWEADDDDPAVPASVITNWFNAVPITIATPDALTLTPVPADAATGVVVSSNLTFTYNNALKDGQLTDDYFYGMKASDGSKVAAALSIDAAKKVVTLNPTSDLEAATDYIAVTSGLVTDVFGQKLAAGTTLINFTTA